MNVLGIENYINQYFSSEKMIKCCMLHHNIRDYYLMMNLSMYLTFGRLLQNIYNMIFFHILLSVLLVFHLVNILQQMYF